MYLFIYSVNIFESHLLCAGRYLEHSGEHARPSWRFSWVGQTIGKQTKISKGDKSNETTSWGDVVVCD